MNVTCVYSRKQTRKLVRTLRAMGITVLGKVAESAILPTSELLLLVKSRQGAYSLHLLGGSRVLPLLTVAEDIPTSQLPFILPLTARQMMGKHAILDFEPTPEDLQAGINLLLAV